MKSSATDDGNIVLFVLTKTQHDSQMTRSVSVSPVPESLFLDAVESVVKANHRWVPPTGRGALYIRPVLWGSGAILGVAPAPEFTFMIYVCPVGPYFKGGLTPINLKVSDEYHRAAPGGSGGVKARKLCTRNDAIKDG